ncbi:MAG: hypothetical protein HFH23_18320 [Ruminococcus sp.]|nr:hypothetical protein [Ruminococcus sp.]
MSQKKVDQYKKEKANRKQTMRKERVMGVVRTCAVTVVALALVGWLGFSAYDSYMSNQERPTVEINYDAVTNYMSGLSE